MTHDPKPEAASLRCLWPCQGPGCAAACMRPGNHSTALDCFCGYHLRREPIPMGTGSTPATVATTPAGTAQQASGEARRYPCMGKDCDGRCVAAEYGTCLGSSTGTSEPGPRACDRCGAVMPVEFTLCKPCMDHVALIVAGVGYPEALARARLEARAEALRFAIASLEALEHHDNHGGEQGGMIRLGINLAARHLRAYADRPPAQLREPGAR